MRARPTGVRPNSLTYLTMASAAAAAIFANGFWRAPSSLVHACAPVADGAPAVLATGFACFDDRVSIGLRQQARRTSGESSRGPSIRAARPTSAQPTWRTHHAVAEALRLKVADVRSSLALAGFFAHDVETLLLQRCTIVGAT
jgi:hypothetical protein